MPAPRHQVSMRSSIRPVVRRALRRSRLHRDALVALHAGGEMHLAELARRIGTSPPRLRECLLGRLPGFRPEFAPLRLGTISRRASAAGATYRLGPAGAAAVADLLPPPQTA